MGLFRRGETVDVLVVDKGCTEIIETKARKDGNMIIDPFLGRQYPVVTKPVEFKKGRKSKKVYILDVEKGCTVELSRNQKLLELKTNPDLIGRVIDSRLIQQAFSIKPETRTILVALIIGLGIGWFIGLLF